jgi:hypothetical protein
MMPYDVLCALLELSPRTSLAEESRVVSMSYSIEGAVAGACADKFLGRDDPCCCNSSESSSSGSENMGSVVGTTV